MIVAKKLRNLELKYTLNENNTIVVNIDNIIDVNLISSSPIDLSPFSSIE